MDRACPDRAVVGRTGAGGPLKCRIGEAVKAYQGRGALRWRTMSAGLSAGDLDGTLPGGNATPPATSERRPHQRGDTLGRYVVLEPIGSGGMGTVYAAYDPRLDRKVALKILHRSSDSSTAAATVREAQTLARLAHPNVVAVHDVGDADGRVFVAMEFVEGSDLRRFVTDPPRPWTELVPLFVAAGRGLAAAHAVGIVHGDFKPENVRVGVDGRVRVLDFGLARLREDPGSTDSAPADLGVGPRLRRATGTPPYMAPEQFASGLVDTRTDVFALCATLYEALWGARPFPGRSAAQIVFRQQLGEAARPERGKVPRAIVEAVLRGLRRDPAERFGSMDALLAALDRHAHPRRRMIVVTAVVGVLAVAITSGVWARDRCADAGHDAARVWRGDTRSQLRQALDAEPDHGDHLISALDDYADHWRAAREDACAAFRVRGEDSEDTFTLRTTCLDRRLTTFAATVGTLVHERTSAASRYAAESLPDIAACEDVDTLQRFPRPPDDPELRGTIAAVLDELALAWGVFGAGTSTRDSPTRAGLSSAPVRSGIAPCWPRLWSNGARWPSLSRACPRPRPTSRRGSGSPKPVGPTSTPPAAGWPWPGSSCSAWGGSTLPGPRRAGPRPRSRAWAIRPGCWPPPADSGGWWRPASTTSRRPSAI